MAWAPCSPSAASPPLHLFDKGYNLASAAFVGSLRSYEPTQRQRDDDALPQEHALSAACLQALRAERLGRRIVAGMDRKPFMGAESEIV